MEGEYGTLVLTDESAEVLGGRRSVSMRKEKAAPAARKESGSRSGKGARVPVDLPAAAEPVFLALRAWRAATAREQGVPAYVVFHDATLREIAIRLPATAEELGTIGGVGEAKLTKYAQGVLDTLAECGATEPGATEPAAGPPAGSAPAARTAPAAVAAAAVAPAPAAPARQAPPAAPYPDEPPFDLDGMEPPWDEDWQ